MSAARANSQPEPVGPRTTRVPLLPRLGEVLAMRGVFERLQLRRVFWGRQEKALYPTQFITIPGNAPSLIETTALQTMLADKRVAQSQLEHLQSLERQHGSVKLNAIIDMSNSRHPYNAWVLGFGEDNRETSHFSAAAVLEFPNMNMHRGRSQTPRLTTLAVYEADNGRIIPETLMLLGSGQENFSAYVELSPEDGQIRIGRPAGPEVYGRRRAAPQIEVTYTEGHSAIQAIGHAAANRMITFAESALRVERLDPMGMGIVDADKSADEGWLVATAARHR